MKLRLNDLRYRVSKKEIGLIIFGFLCIAILLFPSSETIKTWFIHGGYQSLYTDKQDAIKQLFTDIKSAPSKWLRADRSIPTIRLDVKYKEWQKLAKDRKSALKNGLIPEKRNYANATLYDDKRSYRVKIRLQGDLLDHVKGDDRWSLRVEVKDKGALFETSRFALISSNVRVHQGPTLFSETLRIAGFDVVSPKNTPVNVVVNGDDWGVMLVEQAFGQDLLAVNNRTEGLIVRLDLPNETVDYKGNVHRELKARVIQKKTVLRKPALAKQRIIALSLINDFLNGTRLSSDVFDIKKMGQYLAVVDVWGAWHALTWNNWRWYYNPHTAKLEPIQSDVLVSPAKHFWLSQTPSDQSLISRKILEDPKILLAYNSALTHLKTMIDSGELGKKLDQTQKTFNRKLYASSPLLRDYDFSIMKLQADCLNGTYVVAPCSNIKKLSSDMHIQMQSMSAISSWDVESHLKQVDGNTVLVVKNSFSKQLLLSNIFEFDGVDNQTAITYSNMDFPLTIDSNSSVELLLPKSTQIVKVKAGYSKDKIKSLVLNKQHIPFDFLPRANQIDVSDRYPFIITKANSWVIKPGIWNVDDYIITPNDWEVYLTEGTELHFKPEAGLMVFGRLLVNGTVEKPVVFTKQKEVDGWSGLIVFGTMKQNTSYIRNLKIFSAKSPKLGLWQPRGAAYFVNTKLQVNGLSIENNLSEDALNIINSDVLLNNLTIRNALSDGFDCDFCTGSIQNSQFIKIGRVSGGDGLDTSGSTISVKDSFFDQIRDKAISAGENSHLNIENIQMSNSTVAMVSKDKSHIEAKNIQFENIKEYQLMSYTKKSIFGAATLNVNGISCMPLNCFDKVLVENGSVLMIDGKAVQTKKINVKALYKGIMKSDKPQ